MEITTEENRISIDGVSYPKDGFYVKPISKGVALVAMSKSWSIKILVDGTTIDGSPVADRDELMTFFNEQGFKSGGSGPGTEVSWGSITGDIEDQTDLVNYIAEKGGSVELGQGLHFDEDGKVVLGTVDSDESSLITLPFKLTSKPLFEGMDEVEASFHILPDPNSSLPIFLTNLQAVSEGVVINAYNQLRFGSSLTHIGDLSDPSKYVSLEVATQPSSGSVTGGVIITDVAFEKGAIYAADYSANFTDRSLVDKAYVDNKVSEIEGTVWGGIQGNLEDQVDLVNYIQDNAGSSLTFKNGLTEEDGVVKLGGIITEEYSIETQGLDYNAGFGMNFDSNHANLGFSTWSDTGLNPWVNFQSYIGTSGGNTAALIGIQVGNDNGAYELVMSTEDGFTITDDFNGRGVEYASDYSANYTDRSLVDKAFVDSRLSEAQRNAINALVSPETDYADMAEATVAIKSIIDALKAI